METGLFAARVLFQEIAFFKASRLFRGKNPCVSVYVCYKSRSSRSTEAPPGPPQQEQEQLLRGEEPPSPSPAASAV